MADNIVDSLFGPQPWQVQQQQNAGLQQFAAQQANRDPLQMAKYGLTMGGGMLAGAGMEAAGYQNPAVAQAQQRQSVMGMGGDLSTAAGLKAKALQFAQAGDQQTAMKLVLLARKQEQEEAKAKYDAAKASELDARARRELAVAEGAGKSDVIRNAEYMAKTSGLVPGTPDYNEFVSVTVYDMLNKDKAESQTSDWKNYLKAKEGNPSIEPFDQWLMKGKKAGAAGGTTVVMPGEKSAIDIPKFEQSVQGTIKPHLETVTAADMATAALQNSMKTGNYSSFNAAKQQLARAFSDGTISRAEVIAAGADPSMIGGIVDATSTLFTGTPSIDTQQKMLKTLEIARKVAASKGQTALTRMKKVGAMSGIKNDQLDTLLTFPEFDGSKGSTAASDDALIQKHLKKK